ncbi:hypothetical protein GA0070607_2478 [Micromonospora coriariae]|uniref:Uncharacterized protein n=1 Tax=Micromonospora coriariae TaxID=285665 RepID=A0A1C4VQ24_9ACTN|nr:hypothetical protein GA0070607_2478 [Micromonospora coriariae]
MALRCLAETQADDPGVRERITPSECRLTEIKLESVGSAGCRS